MADFTREFTTVARMLGVENPHPWQCRHGGASEDLMSKMRDRSAVKDRGRWWTDASVKRYAKVGKIQQVLRKLSKAELDFCLRSVQLLPEVMAGKRAPICL